MIDIEIIKNWLGKLTSIAYDISEAAKSNNKVSIFTISSTGKGNSNQKPYLTPTRQIEHGWSSGTVVYTQTQAILAARAVDGIVDHIFVDAEKKVITAQAEIHILLCVFCGKIIFGDFNQLFAGESSGVVGGASTVPAPGASSVSETGVSAGAVDTIGNSMGSLISSSIARRCRAILG